MYVVGPSTVGLLSSRRYLLTNCFLPAVLPIHTAAYIDSERSNVHDLHYHTVTPGFIESHLHLSFTATFQRWLDVRLHRCCTLAEVYDRIAQRAQLHKTAPQKPPKGLYPWIACFGLDEGLLPDGREPTRDDLDAVCSEFPIFVSLFCISLFVDYQFILMRRNLERKSSNGGRRRTNCGLFFTADLSLVAASRVRQHESAASRWFVGHREHARSALLLARG